MLRKALYLLVPFVAGCATSPQIQRPQNLGLPLAGSMRVEVRLTQHEIMIPSGHSIAGSAGGMQAAASPSVAAGGFAAGAAAGLIGALIDTAVDLHRSGVAEENVKPMREHMAATHPDDLVIGSFSALDKTHFAHDVSLEVIGRSEADDLANKLLEPAANVLVLVPGYFVSYDGTTFTYALEARLVDRVRSNNGPIASVTRYRQVFQYVVRQDHSPGGARWADLTSEQWKDLLTEAASETVAMLSYDVTLPMEGKMPKDGTMPQLEHKFGDRKWVRTNFGLVSSASDGARPASG